MLLWGCGVFFSGLIKNVPWESSSINLKKAWKFFLYYVYRFKPQTNKDMLTEITHSRHDAMVSFDAAGYCKYNTTSVETAGGTVFASLKKKQGGGKKKPWVKRKRCQVVRKRIRIISTYVNFKKSWPKPSVCGQQIAAECAQQRPEPLSFH